MRQFKQLGDLVTTLQEEVFPSKISKATQVLETKLEMLRNKISRQSKTDMRELRKGFESSCLDINKEI